LTPLRRGRTGAWAAALLICASLPQGVGAQVYHWVDDQGTIHYSTGLESVPERYRPEARALPVPAIRAESEAVASASAITTIQFTPGAPILVSAKINGAGPVTLILDTGADRTMVAPAALGRLGVAIPDTLEATLRGVTGSSRAPVVWVSSLEVGNAAAGPLPIVAHDADLRQADGLLGRDFLALFTVTIDANAGVVTVRRP